MINDGGQNFTYDATGQAATASYSGYLLQQYYDGNGLRAKRTDNGATTYYLRSSLLGGQVVGEITWAGSAWQWNRGYVYLGGELIATQQQSAVYWVHQDPLVKSKRVTNISGSVVSTIELDPWGGNTNRNSNDTFQPHKFTNYERDANASDEAMYRRYNRWWSRFDQPDPYNGSYDLNDPQSFNRYAYVQNDPVNFVDSTGLDWADDFNCFLRGEVWFGEGPYDLLYGWRGPCTTRDAGSGNGGGGGGAEPHGGAGPQPHSQKTPQPDPCTIVNADMGEGGQGWYRYPQKGSQRLDYGQPGVVAAVTNLASNWNQKNPYNPIGIGDLSQFGGGFNNMHPVGGHKGGVIVDIRPMRNDGINDKTNYHDSTYDPILTQALVNDLLALPDRNGNPAVVKIIFNDANIKGTQKIPGDTVHDNHLHVVFRSCP